MKNVGKKFEENLKASIPEDTMYHRLHDAPQSWSQSSGTKFSWKNPCDCFLYKNGILMCLELKTTNSNGYSVAVTKEDKGKMIHYHQIEGLKNFNKYTGCVAGFILNFRNDDEKDPKELTYFIHINDFTRMMNALNKKSFTLMDLVRFSPIMIKSERKRTNFKYDIGSFFNEVEEKYGLKEI